MKWNESCNSQNLFLNIKKKAKQEPTEPIRIKQQPVL